MQIRRACRQDKASVMAILKQTEFFRPEELKVAEEVFDDAIADGCDGDYQSFVATDGHKTIGWVCFGPTPCTAGTFDIYWVAVDRAEQNRGVGTSLVQYATALIKNRKGRMITVDTSGSDRYLPSRGFYEKLGYCKEACIKDFYSAGDDKIIYIKHL
jgi:ribosomal protein S18 acetylase RimI-like enzyme